jgi:hypothetical protein
MASERPNLDVQPRIAIGKVVDEEPRRDLVATGWTASRQEAEPSTPTTTLDWVSLSYLTTPITSCSVSRR